MQDEISNEPIVTDGETKMTNTQNNDSLKDNNKDSKLIPAANLAEDENEQADDDDDDDNSSMSDRGSIHKAAIEDRTENNNKVIDSDEQLYDFQLFLNQLQAQKADPIVRYTRSFIHNFISERHSWSASEQEKLIFDFKEFIYSKYKLYEPFKSMDSIKLNNAKEGMEKLIMGKLYKRCFSPCLELLNEDLDPEHKEDLSMDLKFKKKISEFKFLKPVHLDIPVNVGTQLDKFVKFSMDELSKINRFKAPRDKMVCILNCCKVIFGILKQSHLEKNGADSFIPLLIYTILKSNFDNLYSNIKYIERFRYIEFIRGEESYYLSSLQAAVNFIIELKKSKLTIKDKEEFEEEYFMNEQIHLIEEQEKKLQENNTKTTTSVSFATPSGYILNPLDEAKTSLFNKVSDFFTMMKDEYSNEEDEGMMTDMSESSSVPKNKHKKKHNNVNEQEATQMALQMEHQEHKEVLEVLQNMFPGMEKSLLKDVCKAKKYRIGICVDTLLSFAEC